MNLTRLEAATDSKAFIRRYTPAVVAAASKAYDAMSKKPLIKNLDESPAAIESKLLLIKNAFATGATERSARIPVNCTTRSHGLARNLLISNKAVVAAEADFPEGIDWTEEFNDTETTTIILRQD